MNFKDIRTPSVGLKAPKVQIGPKAVTPQNVPAPTAKRETEYTPGQVLTAWERFIAANQAERLLINAMKAATPQQVGKDVFRVAQSSVHIGYIKENINRITEFVHNVVGNDNISFSLEEVSEDSPLAWNDREALQHIVADSPIVAELIKNLNLSIL